MKTKQLEVKTLQTHCSYCNSTKILIKQTPHKSTYIVHCQNCGKKKRHK